MRPCLTTKTIFTRQPIVTPDITPDLYANEPIRFPALQVVDLCG